MLQYIPVLVVVLSNTVYHICAKSTPQNANTFASLTVTYLVGAGSALALYFLTGGRALGGDLRALNWSSALLGVAVVGLEGGFLYMYKLGWEVSTGQLVASALLEVVLIFVGLALYGEDLTPAKLLGAAICLAGLFLMSR